MHYVKHYITNGVETRQVACIELHGKPNAATEGALGVLGIDVDSPLRDVYKCVAVNGSIYTWELLSSGMSVIRANISGDGNSFVEFPYDQLNLPSGYVVKMCDLIIDATGHMYEVNTISTYYCGAKYCGMYIIPKKGVDYYTDAEKDEWIRDVRVGAFGDIEAAIDGVLAMQESWIGGGANG